MTRMAFIITTAMCLPTHERGPQPKGWKKRLGTCQTGEEVKTPRLFCVSRATSCCTTYCFVKVCQAELSGFWEEFGLMHETDVENDVGSFYNFNAFNGVILQSFSHREINHRMEPQRLVDETLQHFQALIINVFCTFFAWK